jgi:hypothetical protein
MAWLLVQHCCCSDFICALFLTVSTPTPERRAAFTEASSLSCEFVGCLLRMITVSQSWPLRFILFGQVGAAGTGTLDPPGGCAQHAQTQACRLCSMRRRAKWVACICNNAGATPRSASPLELPQNWAEGCVADGGGTSHHPRCSAAFQQSLHKGWFLLGAPARHDEVLLLPLLLLDVAKPPVHGRASLSPVCINRFVQAVAVLRAGGLIGLPPLAVCSSMATGHDAWQSKSSPMIILATSTTEKCILKQPAFILRQRKWFRAAVTGAATAARCTLHLTRMTPGDGRLAHDYAPCRYSARGAVESIKRSTR